MPWPWSPDSRFQSSHFGTHTGRDFFTRLVVGLAALLVLLSGIAVLAALQYFRSEALRASEQLTQSLVHVIEEQTSRTFQTVDQRLLLAASLIQKRQAEKTIDTASARELLQEQLKTLPFVRAIWILDAQGKIVFDSDLGNLGLSLKDREYFQIYQRAATTEFHISAPVKSRSTGNWLVSASHPIRAPDGKVTGVIVAAVEPPYFDALWRGIDLGTGGAVVGSSRVDLQACKLEYSIVSPK